MRDEIYWVVSCSVRPGRFGQFIAVAKGLANATRQESGSLAYDFSANDEQTLVQIFESYANSAAVVHHVTKTFAPFAEAFSACVSIDGFAVYGTPDPAAREILDGFGSDYWTPFEGFTRKT